VDDKCEWNSCQQPIYGGHKFCYYHRKIFNGLLSIEDRSIYLRSAVEKEYAEKTDVKDCDIEKQYSILKTPAAVEIIKLSLHIICKKTKLPRRYFFSDVHLLVLFYLRLPESIQDYRKFIQYHAIRFVGILYNQYLKEKKYSKNEIQLNRNVVNLLNPELEIIKEQQEHLNRRAIYVAKKQMTKIERKVFNLLERGEGETFISNKLRLSKPRITKLKQRAFKRVEYFIGAYG
jgi:hypothetical protein